MNDWQLEVWGDYACFTRPEMKVERVSYDVMTPSAARGIFEAILWKPAIRWNITKIEVLNPIKWISVRRNEVGKKFGGPTAEMINKGRGKPLGLFIEDERQQRAGLFLRDVRYRIHARFDYLEPAQRPMKHSLHAACRTDADEEDAAPESDDTSAKYAAMFERRAKKGQCFHRPYLGCREFACNFLLADEAGPKKQPINETRDLGYMLYDINFDNPAKPKPFFFKAQIRCGVVETDRKVIEVRG